MLLVRLCGDANENAKLIPRMLRPGMMELIACMLCYCEYELSLIDEGEDSRDGDGVVRVVQLDASIGQRMRVESEAGRVDEGRSCGRR